MLRPLALIGTVGMLALSVSAADTQQISSCPTCNNNGSVNGTVANGTTTWYYTDCDDCDHGHCHLCSDLCRTKAFPDKGWNPPAMLPVNRDGIWYQNYWPQAWYGNRGGGFISDVPMVYQPTDTTQLGYSYAKVPTWNTANGANMLPPIPCPAHFHARVCVPRDPACRLPDPCQNGTCRRGYQSGHCPSCHNGAPATAAPIAAPQPQSQLPQQVTMGPTLPAPGITQMSATMQTPVRPTNVQPARSMQQRTRPVSQQKTGKLFDLSGLKSLFK